VHSAYRTADGYPLGKWVSEQRGAYTGGDLSPERVTRLEAVDGWAWDPIAADWEVSYTALLAYVAEHGGARVPQIYRTTDGYPLGKWVSGQRGAYNRGDLSAERITRLEALDRWVWKAS
jgi:hypothetical protein